MSTRMMISSSAMGWSSASDAEGGAAVAVVRRFAKPGASGPSASARLARTCQGSPVGADGAPAPEACSFYCLIRASLNGATWIEPGFHEPHQRQHRKPHLPKWPCAGR